MNRLLRVLLVLISSGTLVVAPARAFAPDANVRPSDQLIPTVDIQHLVDNPDRYVGMHIRVRGIYRIWIALNGGGEIRHRVSSNKILWTEFGPDLVSRTSRDVFDRFSRLSWGDDGFFLSNLVMIDATGQVVLVVKLHTPLCDFVEPGQSLTPESPPKPEPCLVLDRLISASRVSTEP